MERHGAPASCGRFPGIPAGAKPPSKSEQDAREPHAGCVRSITPLRPSHLLNTFVRKRARNRQRSKTRRIESPPRSRKF